MKFSAGVLQADMFFQKGFVEFFAEKHDVELIEKRIKQKEKDGLISSQRTHRWSDSRICTNLSF